MTKSMTKTKLSGLGELSQKRTVTCPKGGWRMELRWHQQANPPLAKPKFGEHITELARTLTRTS
jgi:hypothetical protein